MILTVALPDEARGVPGAALAGRIRDQGGLAMDPLTVMRTATPRFAPSAVCEYDG